VRFGAPFALAAALATLSCAAFGDEVERFPPPSVRVPLAVGGVSLFAAAYGAGYWSSSEWGDFSGASSLAIPVAGPFMALAKLGCPVVNGVASSDCTTGTLFLHGALTAVDGLAQVGGLALVGEALFMTTRPAAEPERVRQTPSLALAARPVVRPGLAGVALAGTF